MVSIGCKVLTYSCEADLPMGAFLQLGLRKEYVKLFIHLQELTMLGRDLCGSNKVDGHHAVIKREIHNNHQKYSVEDNCSRNGTFLNGIRLLEGESKILREGDILTLGLDSQSSFVFEIKCKTLNKSGNKDSGGQLVYVSDKYESQDTTFDSQETPECVTEIPSCTDTEPCTDSSSETNSEYLLRNSKQRQTRSSNVNSRKQIKMQTPTRLSKSQPTSISRMLSRYKACVSQQNSVSVSKKCKLTGDTSSNGDVVVLSDTSTVSIYSSSDSEVCEVSGVADNSTVSESEAVRLSARKRKRFTRILDPAVIESSDDEVNEIPKERHLLTPSPTLLALIADLENNGSEKDFSSPSLLDRTGATLVENVTASSASDVESVTGSIVYENVVQSDKGPINNKSFENNEDPLHFNYSEIPAFVPVSFGSSENLSRKKPSTNIHVPCKKDMTMTSRKKLGYTPDNTLSDNDLFSVLSNYLPVRTSEDLRNSDGNINQKVMFNSPEKRRIGINITSEVSARQGFVSSTNTSKGSTLDNGQQDDDDVICLGKSSSTKLEKPSASVQVNETTPKKSNDVDDDWNCMLINTSSPPSNSLSMGIISPKRSLGKLSRKSLQAKVNESDSANKTRPGTSTENQCLNLNLKTKIPTSSVQGKQAEDAKPRIALLNECEHQPHESVIKFASSKSNYIKLEAKNATRCELKNSTVTKAAVERQMPLDEYVSDQSAVKHTDTVEIQKPDRSCDPIQTCPGYSRNKDDRLIGEPDVGTLDASNDKRSLGNSKTRKNKLGKSQTKRGHKKKRKLQDKVNENGLDISKFSASYRKRWTITTSKKKKKKKSDSVK